MRVELHGGQFSNIGALQMLTVASTELRRRIPNVELVTDLATGTRAQLETLGISPILVKRGWTSARHFDQRFLGQRIVAKMGWHVSRIGVPINCIDALVDISGFAYTDQWGVAPMRGFSAIARYYAARGAPIVMLPQAFGPFALESSREYMREICEYGDLIYARDRTSFEHLTSCGQSNALIKIAPDLTVDGLRGVDGTSAVQGGAERPVFIVPNIRICDRGGIDEESYLDCLVVAANMAWAAGLTPKVLVHDRTGDDAKLGEKIRTRVEGRMNVVIAEDPVRAKDILGSAYAVVGSRYHALLGALCRGVPVLAMGWSHKYSEMMRNFDVERYEYKFDEDNKYRALLSSLLERSSNQALRHSIEKKGRSMLEEKATMWDEVAALLERRMYARAA